MAVGSAVSFGQNGAPAAGAVAPAEGASTNSVAAGNEVMPLIVIDEAPLPDAIRNLARTANLNIQFDPKVLAATGPAPQPGQPPVPPPTVTFRWENITPLQALRAVVDNYGLQLNLDPQSKITRVTYKDPTVQEPLVSRVISLRYSHPTNMIPLVKSVFTTSRSQVLSDTRTSQLVILATEAELDTIDDIVARIDSAPSQVLIEARFIQTQHNPSSVKGINWERTFAAQRFTFGNNFDAGGKIDSAGVIPPGPITSGIDANGNHIKTPVNNPIAGQLPGPESSIPRLIATTSGGFQPTLAFLNADGVSAVLSFFNSDNDSEVVATPRAVALDGVPTELAVVRNIPVLEEQQGTTSGGVQQANTIKVNYELKVRDTVINEVGTKLTVTPRIYAGSNVFLDLKPELSQLGLPVEQTLSGRLSSAPTFERRRINTQAMIPSGTTLVLGGLNTDANNKAHSKVPVLGDLPGLGYAFRHSEKSRDKQQLIIFVTPTIIAPDDYMATPEARDFLKQKAIDKPDVKWGPMDSTEPRDWTKPVQ